MTASLRSLLILAILALGIMPLAVADVPKTLTYQGTLTDGAGQPISGERTITFSLYTVATAGTAFWSEPQTLTLVDGRLSVVLGPLDTSQFTGDTYIGIKVGADTEMPRQKFSSVAYAFQAGDGGVPKGGIIMWNGAEDAIPAGWALCNGLNGTPNLRDRFIVGASTSKPLGRAEGKDTINLQHSHIVNSHGHNFQAGGGHSHGDWTADGGSHYHRLKTDTGGHGSGINQGDENRVTDNGNPENHRHQIYGDGHHDHGFVAESPGTNIGLSPSQDILPPYYALAFIIKL